jgi:hypothetical protein
MNIKAKKTNEGMLLSFEDYERLMERLEELEVLEDSIELEEAIRTEQDFVDFEDWEKKLKEEGKISE